MLNLESKDSVKDNLDSEGIGDVWILIGDVCDKYQVFFVFLIVDQVDYNVEVAKMMSDIVERLLKKKIRSKFWK